MSDQRLRHLLDESERVLTAGGVWSPRSDATELAAHVMGVRTGELKPDMLVTATAADALRALVSRRADRIPLGRLTGRASFGGMEITVGEGVFIPRFHSEYVLEWGLSMIRDVDSPVVVDLCAGSGALALAIAHRRPDAEVHAVDVADAAVRCARQNAEARASLGDTPITVSGGDVADPELLASLDGQVHLITANPPYEPEGADLQPEWAEHHPPCTIFGGKDGLEAIRQVITCASRLLRPGGRLAIEHGEEQATALPALLIDSEAFTFIEDHRGYDERKALDPPLYATARRKDATD